MTDPSRIELPDRPRTLTDAAVAGWREPVSIDTYQPDAPDRYPAFLDRRVYQGSSGRVYPLPFFERISATKRPQRWDAVHLENAYVRLMILPELGGRIHVGYDKIADHDFFFRNEVIKPALVGLAGPWIAGGVEFNWPQHHRPATYLPTDCTIETEADGSVTVWCSDHDPFTRMKGMHGVRLRPDSSLIELRVRLNNRTDLPQTFLWWANVAPRATPDYQSFFPTDVTMVADHAKRAVTSFPHADRPYYGIDYPSRDHDGDRLDWYRNIPVPTSYMALGSAQDFFGGYDHGVGAGFVHVADHLISVGKKQWTWGDSEFGRAWCANLTDDDSVYIELMAGVFTDNQPDFSHLAPGETKVFSQYWFPISGIGPVQQAGPDGALRVDDVDDGLRVRLAATRTLVGAEIVITNGGWSSRTMINAEPGRFGEVVVDVPVDVRDHPRIALWSDGVELMAWQREEPTGPDLVAAEEPPPPEQIAGVEELYLTGAHLEQYRHATRSPEPYWIEALRRDPGHAPTATALALRRYRDGRLAEAEALLRTACARLTALNPNPADTTAFYLLGLVLARTQRAGEAYEAFGRALWTRTWRAPAGFQLAILDAAAGRNRQALERLDDVLRCEPDHLQARALQVIVLRRQHRPDEATAALQSLLALDPLHGWGRHLAGERPATDAQTCLDVALEYRRVGELEAALDALDAAWVAERDASAGSPAARPLIDYHRMEILAALGRPEESADAGRRAATEDARWCFPGRLDDLELLQRVSRDHPSWARPYALAGMWLYAHDRPAEAVESWRRAVEFDAEDPVSWRNLGLAAFNHDHDLPAAVRCYDRALEFAPEDGRLIFERDQLDQRAGADPAERLARLAKHAPALADRDDAAIERAQLLLSTGDLDRVTDGLLARRFQPWEGGEGQVLRAWDRACLGQAHRSLRKGAAEAAVDWIRRALDPPDSLGEKRHPLANSALLHLVLGDAYEAAGDHEAAVRSWTEAADQSGDFLAMSTTAYSESTAASVLALRRLGRDDHELVAGLQSFVDHLEDEEPTIDYFATSLPTLLLFDADLDADRRLRVGYLRAQLDLLAGDEPGARQRVEEILAVDPGHADAVDLPLLVGLARFAGATR